MAAHSFIADILRRLAPQIGATVVLEPEYERTGYITFADSTRSFFRDNRFDLNPLGSIKVAQDKAHCRHFLKSFGYSVPDEVAFWNRGRFPGARQSRHVEDALQFASRVGYPVFVKPNDRSQGVAVRKVYNGTELRQCAQRALGVSDVAIVQKAYSGRDYRIVVLDGKVISAYERLPLSVTGDGRQSVQQLLAAKQREFRVAGRDTILRVDAEVRSCLRRQGLRLASVLGRRSRIRLRDVANLSGGGESIDVTSKLHRGFAALACAAAGDLGLRFCGIDMITRNISQPPGKYVILEVNSAPGLDHYALPDPAAQQQLVDDLYLQVLRAVQRTPRAVKEQSRVNDNQIRHVHSDRGLPR